MAGMYLFTGKGGAGKTTCAAAFSLALAGKGRKVLLVSLDPAHNLGDALDLSLGPEPKEAFPGLRAMEADLERVVEEKTRRARRLLEEKYRYLSVASLDPLLSILGKAPGVEEQAAAEVLADLYGGTRTREEVLVVDLPPSGQAWRVLALPFLTLRWTQSLLDLRKKVLDRRKTLFHVLGEETPAKDPAGEPLPSSPRRDPVTLGLEETLRRNQTLAEALPDPSLAQVVGVTLPSRLSLLETRRLVAHLGEWSVPIGALVLNRAGPSDLSSFRALLGRDPQVLLPDLSTEPRGRKGLEPLAAPLLGIS